MVRIFVRHPVTDYGHWRTAYDAFDAVRQQMGVTGHGVYRGVDDPNDVTVWHDFASAEQAKAFAASDELRHAMDEAGVAGPPAVWFVTPA